MDYGKTRIIFFNSPASNSKLQTLNLFTYILVLFAIVVPCSAFGDYLITSRSGNIKKEPKEEAVVILHVEKGERLVLLDDGAQKNKYYKVQLPGGHGEGWIYRTLVKRYAGAASVGTTVSPVAKVAAENVEI